jgi:hypothetical protein
MWPEDISWPSVVMGWPAIGLSLGLYLVALAARRWQVAAAGAVTAVPFCWYLTLAALPLGSVVLVANVASVIELRRKRHGRAALMLLPFIAVSGVLALAVWR